MSVIWGVDFKTKTVRKDDRFVGDALAILHEAMADTAPAECWPAAECEQYVAPDGGDCA